MTAQQVRQRMSSMASSTSVPALDEDEADEWIEEIRPLLRLAFKAGQRSRRATPTKEAFQRTVQRVNAKSIPSEPESPKILSSIPDDKLPTGWRKVLHVYGEEPCRQPALLLKRMVANTEVVNIGLIRRINGQLIRENDPAFCGSCGYELHNPFSRRDLDWAAHTYTVPGSTIQTATFVEPVESNDPSSSTSYDPSRMTASDVVDASSVMDNIENLTKEAVTSPVIPDYPTDLRDEEALRDLAAQLEVYTGHEET